MLRFGLLMCVCLFSWVARFFLLLGPWAHLVFTVASRRTCVWLCGRQVDRTVKPVTGIVSESEV